MKKYLVLAFLACSVFVAHAQYGGADYGRNDVRQANLVKPGQVVDVVASNLNVDASSVSRVVGGTGAGLVCAVASRRMSDWSSRAALIGLCGMAGERAGAAFGSDARRASTLIVRIDSDNRTIAVLQEDPEIQVGSKVYVITGSNATRVVLAGR